MWDAVWRFIRKYILRRWLPLLIILMVAADGFIDLAGDVWLQEGLEWDVPVMQAIHTFSTPLMDTIFTVITHTAGTAIIIPIVLVCGWLWYQRQFYRLALLIVSVVGNGLLNLSLKLLFERPRPDVFPPVMAESSFSFPSGHTASAVAFYGVLAVFLWEDRRRGLALLCGLWVLLVAFSRVYLGVHYPSDVLASFSLGVVWVILVILNDERRAAKNRQHQTA